MAFNAIYMPSPNYSEREGVAIDTIMLHSTGGALEGALSWLRNPESKVSAHYLIARSGIVYKLVATSLAAWHAGKCRVENANKRSIGIELEQKLNQQWTAEQEDVTLRLIQVLRRAIPTIRYLVGHKEWTSRKRDPYKIDMDELRARTGLSKL